MLFPSPRVPQSGASAERPVPSRPLTTAPRSGARGRSDRRSRPPAPARPTHDQLIGERAIDGQVAGRLGREVSEADRHDQEAGPQAQRRVGRRLDQRLLHPGRSAGRSPVLDLDRGSDPDPVARPVLDQEGGQRKLGSDVRTTVDEQLDLTVGADLGAAGERIELGRRGAERRRRRRRGEWRLLAAGDRRRQRPGEWTGRGGSAGAGVGAAGADAAGGVGVAAGGGAAGAVGVAAGGRGRRRGCRSRRGRRGRSGCRRRGRRGNRRIVDPRQARRGRRRRKAASPPQARARGPFASTGAARD